MKCLVTGGAGFIGSHLCDRLLAEGHSVICIDNLITGNQQNIAHQLKNPYFQFIEHDCALPLPDTIEVQVIFHFASPASPPKYQLYPIETLLVNTVGTYNLLKLAKKCQAQFIYASTSEVYGDPKEHPQTETYWGNVNPNGPRSCYDEAKRCGEAWVMAYIRKFGIDGRIIRIFNTYGPRMDIDDGRVVTNFIKQIISGEKIVIYGTGSQTRSFCFVSDLVDGIIKVFTTKNLQGEVINLGNTEEYTIQSFAKFVAKTANYLQDFVYKPLPQDDPMQRKPDISKAQKLLDWQPRIELKTGIEKTFDYFKER